MADVKIQTVRITIPTSGTTLDATISGFGDVQAVLAFNSNATANDTLENNGIIGIGYLDRQVTPNEVSVTILSEDAQTASDTKRRHTTNSFITSLDIAGAFEYNCSFNSYITDGVRINLDVLPSSATLVTLVFFGGIDTTDSFASTINLGTGTSAIDVTAPGFEPSLVFMSTIGHGTPTAVQNNAIFSTGVCINDGADTQAFSALFDQDGQGTANVGTYVSDGQTAAQVFNDSVNWLATIGSFDASGFSIIPSASASSDLVFYLAIRFSNNPDISLDLLDGPTTTGDFSVTAPGFEPSFGLIFTSDTTAVNINQSGEGIGLYAFDATNDFHVVYGSDDAVGTSNSGSLNSDSFHDLDGTTNLHVGTFSSFDANGFTLNFTIVPSTARKWPILTIGDGVAAAGRIMGSLAGKGGLAGMGGIAGKGGGLAS